MATDWQTSRELMSAAIDFAEAVETAGFSEEDRSLIVQAGRAPHNLYDFMVSAYTMPEALRYDIIRQRHNRRQSPGHARRGAGRTGRAPRCPHPTPGARL